MTKRIEIAALEGDADIVKGVGEEEGERSTGGKGESRRRLEALRESVKEMEEEKAELTKR